MMFSFSGACCVLAAIIAGIASEAGGQLEATSALPTSPSTPAPTSAPTPAPCTPLLFDQRQYRIQTTERYIGVLTVLIPAANSGVRGYNVRTPGYESSLILNNVTGILQKARTMPHQRVELLVQGETANSEKKDKTNNTDIVDVDETLIIVDIVDENDSPPVLDCSPYGDTCDNLVVGFPVSDTAVLPAPLLRLTSTDADTGSYGTPGVVYSVNSSSFSIDQSGLLWLVDSSIIDEQIIQITAKDNFGQQPYMQTEAYVTAVPVTDRQLFFVSTERQLTNTDDVTALLEDIRTAGGFSAVRSLDFQAINYGGQVTGVQVPQQNSTRQLYVYAVSRTEDGAYGVVEADEFRRALEKMAESEPINYVESREDQMDKGGEEETSNTGLIVALSVVSCLLVIVIAAAAFREHQVRHRLRNT